MSEYSDVMDDMYEKADLIGATKPDTAWLRLSGIDWPNPHYKGEPVCHPLDTTGTQTNPPQQSPIEKYRNGGKA